jgi:tRNA threonylcarbamoyladenosine biosynthesis protein TsaB
VQFLALESSTDLASCALWRDGHVLERACLSGEPSSATLLPAIAELLAEAGASLGGIDAIVFGAGPGSFTGLRVACGMAQGLAFARDIPVVPIGSLATIAESCTEDRVMAVLDARMREVYFGQFRRDADAWTVVGEIGVAPPDAVPLPPAGWVLAGNALRAYPELQQRCAAECAQYPDLVPKAGALVRLGARSFLAGGGVAAELALPIYVRDKVAMTVAERLAQGGKA